MGFFSRLAGSATRRAFSRKARFGVSAGLWGFKKLRGRKKSYKVRAYRNFGNSKRGIGISKEFRI